MTLPTIVTPKPWYTSKIIWVNLISIVAEALESHALGTLTAEDRVYILGAINIILRFFTSAPIVKK